MFFKKIANIYESIGIKADGSQDRAIAIKTFNWILLLTFVSGSTWTFWLFHLGQTKAVIFPALAAFCIPFILIYFNKVKNFVIPVDIFIFMMLVLPSFVQVYHGGFVNSGAVIAWSVVAPMTALAFKSPKEAKKSFLIFIGVVLLTIWFELYMPPEFVKMTKEVIITQFAINLIGIIAVCFFPLLNFSKQLMSTRKLLRKKNKEVFDSIYYAKNIQSAILLKRDEFKKMIQIDSFLFYEPKDIVSGDFYWSHRKGNNLYLVCSDCTGHGVPGAFMTIMGINHLNNIVKEKKEEDPSMILKKLNDEVINALRYSDSSLRDGMDITICKIDTEKREIEYVCAGSTIFYFNGDEIIRYANNKTYIGYSRIDAEFKSEKIKLKEGDCIYLLSDGYIDQFGGPRNKRFGSKRLKEMLKDIAMSPIEKQEEIIGLNYIQWKGTEEQIDDITFIGLRF